MKKCPFCEVNYINDDELSCKLCESKSVKNDCNSNSYKLNNASLYNYYKRNFNIDEKGFLLYLGLRGYKLETNKYTKSTTFGYHYAIKKVCDLEKVNFAELVENIEKFCKDYSQTGRNSEIGNIGNGTVRNSLNRLKEFKEYIDTYQK